MFYNNVSTGIDSFGLPCCFKNISDVGKPLKITHLQPKVVSRFTKRNMKLIQKVYMNLFHLLATYFAQSVFFFRY